MDIPSNTTNDDITKGLNVAPNAGADDSSASAVTNDQSGVLDPLAGMTYEEDGKTLEFNANETISTSDASSVGGYTEVKDTTPLIDAVDLSGATPTAVETEPAPAEPEVPANLSITDPQKLDFIKTYTKEYDDIVATAAHSVEMILAAIDKTVKDHTNDIEIPEEASAFLAEKPKNGKVPKFDDAQEIVHTIIAKANEAKQLGEKAALEASKVYDDIQQFKRETKAELVQLRNHDSYERIGASKVDDLAIEATVMANASATTAAAEAAAEPTEVPATAFTPEMTGSATDTSTEPMADTTERPAKKV